MGIGASCGVSAFDEVMLWPPDYTAAGSAFLKQNNSDDWEAHPGLDGRGQGYFEITGNDDGGLRVFLTDSIPGEDGNGWTWETEVGTNGVDVDTDARHITITRTTTGTLTTIKALIDAETELESVYYSAAATTDQVNPDVQSGTIDNAHEPCLSICSLHGGNDQWIYVGDSKPPEDSASTYNHLGALLVRGGDVPATFLVPAGKRVWFRARGTGDAWGWCGLWKMRWRTG